MPRGGRKRWGRFRSSYRTIGFATFPLLAASGQVVWGQPAGQAKTSYVFVEGLLASSTLGNSGGALETTSYGYFLDGRLKSLLDPSGRTRSYTWTPRGLLASETYGDGTTLDRTDYTYDVAGNLASVWKGGDTSATRLFEHGPRGELRKATQPGGIGEFASAYDGVLQPTGITPPPGSAIPDSSFTYDPQGRLTSRRRGISTWTSVTSNGWTTTTTPTHVVERALVVNAVGQVVTTWATNAAGARVVP